MFIREFRPGSLRNRRTTKCSYPWPLWRAFKSSFYCSCADRVWCCNSWWYIPSIIPWKLTRQQYVSAASQSLEWASSFEDFPSSARTRIGLNEVLDETLEQGHSPKPLQSPNLPPQTRLQIDERDKLPTVPQPAVRRWWHNKSQQPTISQSRMSPATFPPLAAISTICLCSVLRSTQGLAEY